MSMTYPEKPTHENGFKKPVSWLLGPQLISSLRQMALYVAYRGKLDPRDWMEAEEFPPKDSEHAWQNEEGGFWFDYIADCGDGQMATYSIAYLCLNDLWIGVSPAEDPQIG